MPTLNFPVTVETSPSLAEGLGREQFAQLCDSISQMNC